MSKAIFKLRGKHLIEEANVNVLKRTVELDGKQYGTEMLSFDAPVSGTVYGVLLNYKGALHTLGDAVNQPPYKEPPKAPILYIKPVNTYSGNGMPIPLPEGVEELEMGAALGVVIGKPATRVSTSQALEYVAGYTIVNDVSIPHDSVYRPAVNQKARDGFCPIGPWVIERDAVANPDQLRVRVFINDEMKQENTTANLIRSVSRLIVDVTDFMTLNKGDVLLVGVPEKAPLAKAGDRVRVEIDELGCLENTIVPESELTGGVAL
ncbi:fumarylacetoacetate hydrolase family protein [Fictibacillus gelatini]|uniref:fumarylacetoacetate hydrolase family protein n=1 Tax=Fictibacillus gelatini TaxID=225985 RepID=UPI0003F5EAC8|nr:fumarylacetoacetate hydrolase family protein [Fictibacillus gelatini]